MTLEKKLFGRTKQGENVYSYTLKDSGYLVEILTYGAAIRSLIVPVNGQNRDVALGFDDVASYEDRGGYLGAIIGRFANRIGGAQYVLDGKEYFPDKNDDPNSLHGGFNAFDKQVWDASEQADALVLTLRDEDGKHGFPGNLNVEVKYSLQNGILAIEYMAQCDQDTPINLTNHNYFNLGGHNHGEITDHTLQIFSDKITPIDNTLIPTGELMAVEGTPLDFRVPAKIGDGINSNHQQILLGGGYDHNYVLSGEPVRSLSPAAVLEFDGLKMQCATTKPGVQFYSGNFIPEMEGKGSALYKKRSGLCLETQSWPDSVNKPEFPDCILRKGKIYKHVTQYSFSF